MIAFQLFRVKVFLPGQQNLLRAEDSAVAVLRRVIGERPSRALRRGVLWHVGNLKEIDEDSAYLRFGKSRRDSIPVLDERTGDFREQEFETAPFTHVLLEFPNELCAIAGEPALAGDTVTIARQLARVLEDSNAAVLAGAAIEISEILDPDDFIRHLQAAFAIKKFTLMLSRPNPFDAHEDFQRPFERFVKESHGTSGKTEVKGTSLDRAILQDLARSAGITGNDASAMVQARKGARAEKKRLKGSSIVLKREDVSTPAEQLELVLEIRQRMERMRSHQ